MSSIASSGNFPVNLLFAGDQVRYAARDTGKSGGFDIVFMVAPHPTAAVPTRIVIRAVEGDTSVPRSVACDADEPLEVIPVNDDDESLGDIPATLLDMPVAGLMYSASVRIRHRGEASLRGPHAFSQGTWENCRVAVVVEFPDNTFQAGYSKPFLVTGNGSTKNSSGSGSGSGSARGPRAAAARGSRAAASARAAAVAAAAPAAAVVPVPVVVPAAYLAPAAPTNDVVNDQVSSPPSNSPSVSEDEGAPSDPETSPASPAPPPSSPFDDPFDSDNLDGNNFPDDYW